jgi:hypothetical protein
LIEDWNDKKTQRFLHAYDTTNQAKTQYL